MSMPSPIKAPMIDSSTQEFWDAARRGVLRIKRCADCGAYHYYPRPFCPKCWSTNVAWIDAVRRLATDEQERSRLIAAGRRRLGELDYRHTAQVTLEVLREAAQS